jgi:putative oxidoreductase
MDLIVLIARVLFVGVFLVSAMGHLTQTGMMAGYAASKGVPLARPVVLISGVQILLGALSVLLGVWADLGALLLVAFLVPTAFVMHGFWREAEPQAKMTEQVQFVKDLALAGGALFVFVLVASLGEELGLVVTSSLFDLG